MNDTLARFVGMENLVNDAAVAYTVIEDRFLCKKLIDGAIYMESLLDKSVITIDYTKTQKTPTGLCIDISMSKPNPLKPAIFKFIIRYNETELEKWYKDHKYLMGGHVCTGICKYTGITYVFIGDDKWYKSHFSFTVHYPEDDNLNEKRYHTDDSKGTMEFLVHRNVINNHAWTVKARL